MRDYIQKHIQPALDKARAAINELTDRLAAEETFGGSIVPGTTNKREALKNCLVFGEVQVEGSGTMADCLVMSGSTVYIGDGSTVTNSLFSIDSTSKTKISCVRIGKHVKINKVFVNISMDIGDNSCIVEAAFGDDHDSNENQTLISLGANTLISIAAIRLVQPVGTTFSSEMQLGDGAVILNGKLTSNVDSISVGNDALFCEYDYAMGFCLGEQIKTATEMASPVSDLTRFKRDLLENRIAHTIFHVPVKAGDGLYLGIGTRFLSPDNDKAPGAELGNNVFILPAESLYNVDDMRGTSTFCSVCAEHMVMEDNSTLILDIPSGYESQQLKDLCIKEGATLFFRNNEDIPSERFTGSRISINKNKVIEL